MSSSVVRSAVWTKMDEWTDTRVIDLENTRDPAGTTLTPWASVQFLLGTEEQICLADVGDRGWREEGSFQLLMAVPTYTGASQCLTHMDNLRALFRVWSPADMTIRKVHPAFAMIDHNELLGNWYILTALVSYYRDFYE